MDGVMTHFRGVITAHTLCIQKDLTTFVGQIYWVLYRTYIRANQLRNTPENLADLPVSTQRSGISRLYTLNQGCGSRLIHCGAG